MSLDRKTIGVRPENVGARRDAVRPAAGARLRTGGPRSRLDLRRAAGRRRAVPVHARAPRDACTAASRGRCGCSPGFGTPGGHQPALPLPARARADRPVDGVRHADADGLRPRRPAARAARSGAKGVSVASVADIERLFADIPLDQVTTSMTINAPAVVLLAFYVVAAERRGIAPEALRGTIQNDMLKEFIAQKEWICGVRPSLRIIRDMLVDCTARMPLLEHDQHQRLPHPRSGRDRRAGAGVHAGRRHRLRRARPRRGPGRRRVRAAAVVLLGRPQRLLRGDRQAARRAPHVGADHARPLRRQEPARLDAARARADGGRVAGGAAAAQQRRAHDAAGAGGRAGRHAVAAHQQLRRDATRCRPKRRRRWRCARSRSSPRSRACRRSPIRSAAATTSSR